MKIVCEGCGEESCDCQKVTPRNSFTVVCVTCGKALRGMFHHEGFGAPMFLRIGPHTCAGEKTPMPNPPRDLPDERTRFYRRMVEKLAPVLADPRQPPRWSEDKNLAAEIDQLACALTMKAFPGAEPLTVEHKKRVDATYDALREAVDILVPVGAMGRGPVKKVVRDMARNWCEVYLVGGVLK